MADYLEGLGDSLDLVPIGKRSSPYQLAHSRRVVGYGPEGRLVVADPAGRAESGFGRAGGCL
jgi:hypothetical protein